MVNPASPPVAGLLERKDRELAAILEISRVLTASFDLEENLGAVMRVLSGGLEMQRGCVFLRDPSSAEVRIVAAHGLTREEALRGKYRIGEGIVGRVMESGKPMFIPNIGEEPKFLNKTGSRPDKNGISFICEPIRFKGEMLGVITIDRIYSASSGGVDDDIRVLQIVSSLIAQFVKLWESFRKVEEEKETLKRELRQRYSLPNIIGESEKFQGVLKTIMKVAGTDTTVLLLGESGTGKELIAHTTHYQSPRVKGPFVAVNCAALPENLLEVELFGQEKGAFTGADRRRTGRFEAADGGTLFLDEIGELPLQLQAKLLRVLEEKTFERVGSSKSIKADVRIIAATNRNLEDEVRKGAFRADLYWRLNVVSIVLPPLRERQKDIALLVDYYLEKFNRAYGKDVRVSAEALRYMIRYSWPGNIRELANTIERLVIMAEKDTTLETADLPYNFGAEEPGVQRHVPYEADSSLGAEVKSLERQRIVKALKENDFVQQKTAFALGITPRKLAYRIKKYGIDLAAIK
ncbi:MAG: sigma 54-interacting transcriptional regulator [Nitrospiraceae bacterium]|nr:sigma 54-interacting transcriptional regulator [Nitrospiraceae bacterium]